MVEKYPTYKDTDVLQCDFRLDLSYSFSFSFPVIFLVLVSF